MKTIFFTCLSLTVVFLCYCNNRSDRKIVKTGDEIIIQQEDGTISLKLENAGCYSDVINPSNNTAEWNMVISKPGHYKVWLSSATRDTIDLNYTGTVKVNLLDSQLVVIPLCDKIIQNSKDVSYPYFQADSYLGSFYISEAGEYSIQVISEKVISKESGSHTASLSDSPKLMAIILTPITR